MFKSGMSDTDNIRVGVRLRPLSAKELNEGRKLMLYEIVVSNILN